MVQNLRITLVAETYFPQINGVSRTLDRLVKHCSERGDRLQLLIPSYDDNPAALPPRVEKCEFGAIPLPFYREIVLPVATVKRVERALLNFRPDLVHIATEGPLGLAALRAAKRLGLTVVSSYHTNFSQYLGSYHAGFLEPLGWKYLRWFHNATQATFCPTPSTRRMLEGRGLNNLAIWSRGVDSHRFHPGKRDDSLRESLGLAYDEKLLVYTGRIANEKNLEMLMHAWQLLVEDERCHLLIIGDGPLRPRLEAMSLPRVNFVGYRYAEELARLYASCDLFVFPSLSETFGNVVLEAMASGLPVVGFNVQGPGDIVQSGTTGHLIEEISAETLASTIRMTVADKNSLGRMGRSARAYAETRSWQQIMGCLRDDYVDLVDAARFVKTTTTTAANSRPARARRSPKGKTLLDTNSV